MRLQKCRNRLQKLDERLIQLIDERFEIVSEIGKIKCAEEIKIRQKDFWKKATKARNAIVEGTQLNQRFVRHFFEAIQKESIRVQHKIKKENRAD